MDEQKDELVKRLIDENETFRNNYKAHKDYGSKVARLDKKPYLSPEETAERARLKKLKLALKDEMEKELAKYRKHN